MGWQDEERQRAELREARAETRAAMELGRRTAVHAGVYGFAVGAVWMWLMLGAWR